MSHLVSV